MKARDLLFKSLLLRQIFESLECFLAPRPADDRRLSLMLFLVVIIIRPFIKLRDKSEHGLALRGWHRATHVGTAGYRPCFILLPFWHEIDCFILDIKNEGL